MWKSGPIWNWAIRLYEWYLHSILEKHTREDQTGWWNVLFPLVIINDTDLRVHIGGWWYPGCCWLRLRNQAEPRRKTLAKLTIEVKRPQKAINMLSYSLSCQTCDWVCLVSPLWARIAVCPKGSSVMGTSLHKNWFTSHRAEKNNIHRYSGTVLRPFAKTWTEADVI